MISESIRNRRARRASQDDDTQRWALLPIPGNPDTYTIQQLSNSRFLDAYTASDHDYSVVTRPAQNDDTQRWVIKHHAG